MSVSNLDDDDAVQLALPLDAGSTIDLDVAIDDVRDKFGRDAITRAVLLGRAPGLEMPMLPD
jgi:DNA polymerase-4